MFRAAHDATLVSTDADEVEGGSGCRKDKDDVNQLRPPRSVPRSINLDGESLLGVLHIAVAADGGGAYMQDVLTPRHRRVAHRIVLTHYVVPGLVVTLQVIGVAYTEGVAIVAQRERERDIVRRGGEVQLRRFPEGVVEHILLGRQRRVIVRRYIIDPQAVELNRTKRRAVGEHRLRLELQRTVVATEGQRAVGPDGGSSDTERADGHDLRVDVVRDALVTWVVAEQTVAGG